MVPLLGLVLDYKRTYALQTRLVAQMKRSGRQMEHEISERKQAERASARYALQLEKQNQELDRSNSELEDFAYVTSRTISKSR